MAPAKDPKQRRIHGPPRKRRAGLPDEASVVDETTFTSAKGNVYRVLKTTEKDACDNDGPKDKRRN